MTFLFNEKISLGGNPADQDAFGKLRVSEALTIFESLFQYGKDDAKFDEQVASGGTVTFLPNESAAQLLVTTVTGSKAVRQSKRRIRYSPGKSQLIVQTATLGEAKTNVRSRIGYFDSDDGLFFEQDSGVKRVVVRTSTSGSAVDNQYDQASWNIDTMDGNGPSGVTIDWTKVNIFIMDFQWLGTGSVRFGFDLHDGIFYCHEIPFANTLPQVFMKTAVLPVRVEIENTGVTASATTMKQICTQVASEGGFGDLGTPHNVSNGQTAKVVGTGASFAPLLSVRMKTTTPAAELFLLGYSFVNTSNTYIEYAMFKNGTLTGASFASETAISEVDVAATVVTGGTRLYGGYLERHFAALVSEIKAPVQIDTFIDNSSDIITLACRSLGAASNVYGSLTWAEQK